jgi:hypothetical protein
MKPAWNESPGELHMRSSFANLLSKPPRIAALVAATFFGLAVPASGQRPQLAMLDQLQDGRWELRQRDGHGPVEQICMSDGRRLIQLRHPAVNCRRLVVEDSASEVTVQYTCTGRGYGRTSIRRESGSLVQISTQGIADGLPFDYAIEGRRVGGCSA